MRTRLFILLFTLLPILNFAQSEIDIKVVDSQKSPIYGVLIYNENGVVLGHTNPEGVLNSLLPDGDNSKIIFKCLGFEELILTPDELKSSKEIVLKEISYDMDELVVTDYADPMTLINDSYKYHHKNIYKKIKHKVRFYGNAQYSRTVEANGKIIGSRDEYGLLFTSGNIKKQDKWDVDYHNRFAPIYGAYSYELTSDATDTLLNIGVSARENRNFAYNAEGDRKIDEVVRAIYLFAPIFSDIKLFDFKQIAKNSSDITYSFKTKSGAYPQDAHAIMRGEFVINMETKRLKEIYFSSFDFVYNGLIRNFPKGFPNSTEIKAQIAYDDEGKAYVNECYLTVRWNMSMDWDVFLIGRVPVRPFSAKNNLVEREYYSYEPFNRLAKDRMSGETLGVGFYSSYHTGKYDKEFFEDKINPLMKEGDFSALEKYMPLEQQYQLNSNNLRKIKRVSEFSNWDKEEYDEFLAKVKYARELLQNFID